MNHTTRYEISNFKLIKCAKLGLVLSMIFNFSNSYAQGSPKWSENGNSTSSSAFLGTTNFQPLIFKTNNLQRFYISASGDVVMPLLSGTGTGITILDYSGKVLRLNFSGSPGDVLFGNGTFGSLSTVTGWTTSGGVTFTNNKVGIGVNSPLEKFEVDGNAIFNGTVSAQQFVVGDVTSQGKNLRIASDISFDGYDPLTGMRNELKVMTQPFYINSQHGYNYHTIINADNTGNVGIGTNTPTAKLEIFGSLKVSGETYYSGKSHFNRIAPMPGDSILLFGDSTLHYNDVTNAIYGSLTGSSGLNKGLGLGSVSAAGKGLWAVGIGFVSRAEADNSYTIGTRVKSTAFGAVAIGSGFGTVSMENPNTNSLAVGFSSNIPTFFVGNSAGLNTTGNVGIATTTPEDKLQIKTGPFHKFTIGNCRFSTFEYGTSYLGFNAVRTATGTWKTETDGQHNGGALIFSNVIGNLYFTTIGDINEDHGYGAGISGDHTAMNDIDILNRTSLFIDGVTGNVAIGTTCQPYAFPYKLAVNGKVICEEIKVKISDASGCWPDYVFSKTHKLISLPNLEEYIKTNLHLPGFKSAVEIDAEGINLSETVTQQQKTIEEMYLHIIELNKRIEKLEQEHK